MNSITISGINKIYENFKKKNKSWELKGLHLNFKYLRKFSLKMGKISKTKFKLDERRQQEGDYYANHIASFVLFLYLTVNNAIIFENNNFLINNMTRVTMFLFHPYDLVTSSKPADTVFPLFI